MSWKARFRLIWKIFFCSIRISSDLTFRFSDLGHVCPSTYHFSFQRLKAFLSKHVSYYFCLLPFILITLVYISIRSMVSLFFVFLIFLVHGDGIMPERRMCQNEIFQESSSKFFVCLAACYYHVTMKLPEITKCYWTWKECCFRWYHSFSKIFIHIDVTVHTPFWNWRLHPCVLQHLRTVCLATMVQYALNVVAWKRLSLLALRGKLDFCFTFLRSLSTHSLSLSKTYQQINPFKFFCNSIITWWISYLTG